MTRPLTPSERACLDATMAGIIRRLPPPRRYAPRPHMHLRRRHAVAMAIAAILWLGAIQCAWWLGGAMR